MPYEKVGKNELVCIADEVPFDIPDSWAWVRLSSVVYNHGQTKPEEDFCYIDIGSVDNQHQKLSAEETIISPEKAPSRARKIICKGDIIYSTVRPYLHNMCIIDRNFSKMPIASTGFAVFTCHADFYNEFLFYYLMSPDFDSYANNVENSKGVAYPAINDTRLYKALIPLPPVDEQHRIVDKIKSVLPEIEKYDLVETELSNMNRDFPENLKRSILQWAVQGRVVPQDPSDEPAEVLLERIRTEKQRLVKEGKIKKDKHESVIFRRDNSHYEKRGSEEVCIDDEIPFEIPQTWAWARLKSIAFKITDGTHNSPPNGSTGDYLYITAKNIKDAGVILDPVTYVTKGVHNEIYARCNPEFGDVLLIKDGATTGVVTVNNLSQPFSLLSSVALVKLPKYVLPWYLVYVLRSDLFYKILRSNMKGTGITRITLKQIEPLLVPVPPVNEQQRIIGKVELLLNYVETL